jgi:hypothetical protein
VLISDDYRAMQRALHEDPDYGVASVAYAPLVASLVRHFGVEEMLDYGAGKGRLGIALRELVEKPLRIAHYEPANPEWAAPPAPCRFVACIDVLEHIEPALLENVLDDLQRVVLERGVFTVHTGPARRVLPDGRNAHLIQQPAAWWLERFRSRFEVKVCQPLGDIGFWVGVESKDGAATPPAR